MKWDKVTGTTASYMTNSDSALQNVTNTNRITTKFNNVGNAKDLRA